MIMVGQEKQLYEAPSTLVFEVNTEGVICLSTTDPGWNDEDD